MGPDQRGLQVAVRVHLHLPHPASNLQHGACGMQVAVLSITAAGVGLTLTAASHVVFAGEAVLLIHTHVCARVCELPSAMQLADAPTTAGRACRPGGGGGARSFAPLG